MIETWSFYNKSNSMIETWSFYNKSNSMDETEEILIRLFIAMRFSLIWKYS